MAAGHDDDGGVPGKVSVQPVADVHDGDGGVPGKVSVQPVADVPDGDCGVPGAVSIHPVAVGCVGDGGESCEVSIEPVADGHDAGSGVHGTVFIQPVAAGQDGVHETHDGDHGGGDNINNFVLHYAMCLVMVEDIIKETFRTGDLSLVRDFVIQGIQIDLGDLREQGDLGVLGDQRDFGIQKDLAKLDHNFFVDWTSHGGLDHNFFKDLMVQGGLDHNFWKELGDLWVQNGSDQNFWKEFEELEVLGDHNFWFRDFKVIVAIMGLCKNFLETILPKEKLGEMINISYLGFMAIRYDTVL
jgi:hypothetical protein